MQGAADLCLVGIEHWLDQACCGAVSHSSSSVMLPCTLLDMMGGFQPRWPFWSTVSRVFLCYGRQRGGWATGAIAAKILCRAKFQPSLLQL